MVFFSKIKSFILQKELLKTSSSPRSFPLKVNSVKLFINEQDLDFEQKIRSILQQKWGAHLEITYIYFSPKKRARKEPLIPNIIYSNDFSLFLSPKHQEHKKIIVSPSDLVINLSNTNEIIKKCLLKNKKSYIIGPGGKDMVMYHHFMVNSSSEQVIDKLNTIISYLV